MHKLKIPKAHYVFILLAFLAFFIFHTLPVLEGVFFSFTNWKGYGNFNFVGLKNFINVFHDNSVYQAYGFTFMFAFISTVLVNIISLCLALCLNGNIYGKSFFRAVYFIPNILAILVVSFIFKFIFSSLLPALAHDCTWSGLEKNILGSKDTAWIGLVVVTVWQSVAFNTLLYIAGLQNIPKEIYEAAKIDGASTWTQFKKLTIPFLAPFFTINIVLCVKNFLMVFDSILALTGGGPGIATTSVSVYIYRGGFQGSQFAYQSADAVIFFIIILAISLFQVKVLQKKEEKVHA